MTFIVKVIIYVHDAYLARYSSALAVRFVGYIIFSISIIRPYHLIIHVHARIVSIN